MEENGYWFLEKAKGEKMEVWLLQNTVQLMEDIMCFLSLGATAHSL